jgi:nicotinamide mononucleotide transporter PnuC
MKFFSQFRDLSKFEWGLWLTSVLVITLSFLFPKEKDYMTLIASLIGVTALIFVAKGYVLGQALTVVFAMFYGIVSFFFRYYGEMITYLCMSAPAALMSVVSWIRHPYKDRKEVEVNVMSWWQIVVSCGGSLVVTVAFYFILGALGNANLLVSTLSVATSFLASMFAFFRSPFYALAYAANDVVLIVLWIMATVESVSYLPMVLCFVMFLANDLYGFYNWEKMKKEQKEHA